MMKRDKNGISVLYVFMPLFLIALVVAPQAFAQSETCITAKCHAAMGKDKVVHPPLKDGCATCHQVTQELAEKKTKHPGNLTITLTQKGPDLCTMCHAPKNKKKTVHPPVMGGDCTLCHNPHQSPNKAMLKDPVPNICFQCHSDNMLKHKVMHPPVAGGDCGGCHDYHQSDFPKLLVQEEPALCFTCHPDKQDGLKTKKVIHPPVKQSCLQCHGPHGTPNKAMLSAAVPALCSNCHPNETSLAEKALTKHNPMIAPKTCLNCHETHYSDFAKLIPVQQKDLCLKCHNKSLDTERGKIIDMKSFFAANKNGHGPIKQNNCASCHNPHGSDYWRILTKYYPTDFYTSYSEGKYSLCFSCHDKAAFTDLRTEKSTNFRNGDRNLHFIHVNKAVKGRTCRACHEVHADPGTEHHVKEQIGFSGWAMPMNFSPSKTGGSCAPGCHGEKSYSR